MKKLLLVSLLIANISLIGQYKVSGTISEKVDGEIETIPFTNIFVKEISNGVSSDVMGQYSIKLKPGKYTLVFSFMGYKTKEVSVEVVKSDVTLDVELVTDSELIDVFEVIEKADRETKTMDIESTKKANGLESNIGAKKMAEAGASDVADATKKVVGLSVVGSGNVYVRGMGDRYNSAYLNGLPIASPDPDRKVIPLNLFPTSVIKTLSIKKSFLPNLEGDFAGGAMDIVTKDYPDDKTLKVSLGTGFNSQTIGRNQMTYQGGKYDYFGFDDGTRAVPEGIKNQPAYKSTEGDRQLFATNLNPKFKKVLPNSSFGLFAGNKFDLKNKKTKLGFLVALNHSNSTKYEFGKYKLINAQKDIQINYDVEEYTTNTSTSLLTNIGLDIDKNNFISYNFLFVNLSSDEAKEASGFHWDYARNVYARRFTFKKNSLMSNQVSGSHFLLEKNKLRINWSASLNNAKSLEPDRRQLVYFYDDKEDSKNYTNNATDKVENHRFFSDLNESQIAAKAETKYIFKYNTDNVDDGSKLSITVGGLLKRKIRDFDYTQYVYDLNLGTSSVDVYNPDSYINADSHEAGLFTTQEVINPASKYKATQNVFSGYSFVDYNFTRKFELIAGARVEKSYQSIEYRDQTQPDFKRKNFLDAINLLPSLVLKYQPSDTNIIRFSASKTISRPGFKEVAPFQYTEVFAGATTVGNPELINGENYNFDLRYERYPRLGEFIAFGVFYKYLVNPIEKTMEVATNRLQSFRNAEKAMIAGLEFEFTKSLGFLSKNDSSILKNLSVGINATYLYSKVSFDTSANVAQTNNERALQGASPYLINIDLAYSKWLNSEFKINVSLAYNVFGKRIYNVGTYGLGDIYELPVHSLNFVAGVELKHFTYGIKIKNLLNQDVNFEQGTSQGPELINSTKRGVFTSFTVGYKF